MTFLDYLLNKDDQIKNGSKEWLEYKEKCQAHWEENKENISSYFGNHNVISISSTDIDSTPFKNIPKFYDIFPNSFSLEKYFKALDFECQFTTSSHVKAACYTITNPFI